MLAPSPSQHLESEIRPHGNPPYDSDIPNPALGDETIVGIDDVGRPETPGVEPWVDRVTQAGRLIELARYADDFIRFYKPARNAPVGR